MSSRYPAASGERPLSASDHVAVLAALDYAREERHDRATAEMFAALVSSYWGALELDERRTIAKAVAGRHDLERSLLELFLADHFTVANIVVDVSPLIGKADLQRIAESRVMPTIRVMARRPLPDDVARILAGFGDSATALALALNGAIEPRGETLDHLLATAAGSRHVARALAQRRDLPLNALIALYPELAAEDRRRAVDLAERAALTGPAEIRERPPATALTEEQRIVYTELAKRLDRQDFLGRLNGAMRLAPRYAEALLGDGDGDMQAIVFAGLGFSASEATTLFIVLGASNGRAYADIKQMIELFERVRRRTAAQFLQVWQESRRQPRGERARADSLEERSDPRRAEQAQHGERGRNAVDHGIIAATRPRTAGR